MTHIAEALAISAILTVALCTVMGRALRMLDAYQRGYEDGKDYMRELLLGDHGDALEEWWRLRANKEEQDADPDTAA